MPPPLSSQCSSPLNLHSSMVDSSPVARSTKRFPWLPVLFLVIGLLFTGMAAHQTQRLVTVERTATMEAYALRVTSGDANGIEEPLETVADTWLPWAVAALGALMSMMGALTLAGLQRSRDLSLSKAYMDRSLRRKAEAALHLRERAIDASANAIVIASATERGYPVVYVNPAFERMTGYTSSQVLGESLRIM